ncbi:MAG: hypothetical protein WCF61_11965 [Terriglobales bacterium]
MKAHSCESTDTEAIARSAFAEIAGRFPALKFVENVDKHVEISITIPIQPGLSCDVGLGLQNHDELHLYIGHFWLEWFPCTKRDRVDRYLDAVTGFLSGEYRVLEHYRRGRCYKAQLQKPEGGGWRTIGTWFKGWIPWSLKKTTREIRNQ